MTRRRWSHFALTFFAGAATAAVVALGTVGVAEYLEEKEQPPAKPVLTTAITSGVLESSVEGTVEAIPSRTWDIEAQGTITADGVAANAEVDEGTRLGSVNGRPIFVLLGAQPAFRSLSSGMTGDDVAQVQSYLSREGYGLTDPVGSFGWSTAVAVYEFYSDRGLTPVNADGQPITGAQVGEAGLPRSEYTFAPSFPVVASDGCGRAADRVDGSLCTMRTVEGVLSIEVPVRDSAILSAGMEVRSDGTSKHEFLGTLGQAFEQAPTEATSGPSAESAPETASFLIITPDGEQPQTTVAAGRASVIVSTSPDDGLIVEASAIREDSGGFWLEVQGGVRKAINVGLCSDGYCAIAGDGLHPGTTVILSSALTES